MRKIKLIIVEDDKNWVMAMKLFMELETDFEIAAIAENYQEAVQVGITKDADIILMDINLSGNYLDGIYATAEILCHRDIKIIMLTSINDKHIIENAYIAGAVNYVMKNNYKEIPALIRNIANNITPNEILAKDYMRLRVNELLSSLTHQEKEIFKLFNAGNNKKEIQKIMFISEYTLKNHIHSIIRKLNVKTIHEAVEKVKRKGFVRSF